MYHLSEVSTLMAAKGVRRQQLCLSPNQDLRLWGCGDDGSVNEVLATQTRGFEFTLEHPHKNLGCGVVVHYFNPSTQEEKASGSL